MTSTDPTPPTVRTGAHTWADAPAPGPPAERLDLGPRYEDLGVLGLGGMGEVRRVLDRPLGRSLAMKIVRAELASTRSLRARFQEEARLTARLDHPGIVPVHDLGELPDGRLYFTMREVHGRTLGEVITSVHAASPGAGWGVASDGWSLHRLLTAFHAVCEAVAYAHARGVLHRDLKPANVLVGAWGEVLVVDWGVAKILGGRTADPVHLTVPGPRHLTQPGSVFGTPAYMAPEQRRGDVNLLDTRTDVYLLGGILHEIFSGGPPGSPLSRPAPPELLGVLARATSAEPSDRFADAGALAREVGAWLEGTRRREQALELIAAAAAQAETAARRRVEAKEAEDAARALLRVVPTWADASEKAAGWRWEERAAALAREAEVAEAETEHLLRAALTRVPDLPEAHAALGERHRLRHAAAEEARDAGAAARESARVAHHAECLPRGDATRVRLDAWLRGQATLTLAVDAPGAVARFSRYVEAPRRLVLEPWRSFDLPVVNLALPWGSWLVEIEAPGRSRVRYPVFVRRTGTWREPPLRLPRASDLGPDDCFVAAGPWHAGGDPRAPLSLPARRLWSPSFILRRHPVTNAEYIAFLDDLVAQGREAEALAWAPAERGTADAAGAQIYGRRADGGFEPRPDAEGDAWHLDWPAVKLPWDACAAYAAWYAARTGQPWRLVGELEREKAGRGADGRYYPWGDGFDPSWGCTRDSHRTRPMLASVHAFEADESPYGVRGLAGNVRDWCLDAWYPEGPALDGDRVPAPSAGEALFRPRRGGSFSGGANDARCGFRLRAPANARDIQVGFRLCRSWPG